MNFGYNARAAFGNSVSRFEDHAKDLLGSLVDRRQRDDVSRLRSVLLSQMCSCRRLGDPKTSSVHRPFARRYYRETSE
jgi:hypothetical protein